MKVIGLPFWEVIFSIEVSQLNQWLSCRLPFPLPRITIEGNLHFLFEFNWLGLILAAWLPITLFRCLP